MDFMEALINEDEANFAKFAIEIGENIMRKIEKALNPISNIEAPFAVAILRAFSNTIAIQFNCEEVAKDLQKTFTLMAIPKEVKK